MLQIIILDIVVGLILYGVYRLKGRFGLAPLFALVAGHPGPRPGRSSVV